MKVFKKVFEITAYIGFILFLCLLSFLLTSLIFFNHDLNTINRSIDLVIYQEALIDKIVIYGDNQLTIEVWFKEEKEEDFLVEYAFYYYDEYKLPVQLIDYVGERIIIVSKDGISTSQKLIFS